MSQFKRLLFVSTLFELVWFLAVVGAQEWQWLTVAVVLITLVSRGQIQRMNWSRWALLCLIGIGFDLLNSQVGVLIFETPFIPIWLIALWAMFIWYAQFLVPIVRRYPRLLVVIIGGLAGSLSYLAGFKLGAVQLGYSMPFSFAWLFVEWAAITMLCMRLLNDEQTK